MATSKRVKKAAPLRQRFSLEVSSSKVTPRESRPRTRMGRWTAILRSERCLATEVLTGTMGWVLTSAGPHWGGTSHFLPAHCARPAIFPVGPKATIVSGDRSALTEKTFDPREDFATR